MCVNIVHYFDFQFRSEHYDVYAVKATVAPYTQAFVTKNRLNQIVRVNDVFVMLHKFSFQVVRSYRL